MNPAVTLGVLIGYVGHPNIKNKIIFSMFIVVSQILGALFGCFLVWAISTETNGVLNPVPALLCPKRDLGKNKFDMCDGTGQFISLFVIEMLMTFVFVATVLSIIYSKITNKLSGALIIVSVLYASGSIAGAISGGAINPAVGIAQQIF